MIKKFHRNEGRDDYTSKTSIKLEAHALTKWGKQLVAEKQDLLSLLPLSETTLKALLDYQKMSSHLAKKRHLMFIGKCLRKEDETLIRGKIIEVKRMVMQNKAMQSKADPKTVFNSNLKKLIDEGEQGIEILLQKNTHLDRQKLRQLYRAYNKENESKQWQALNKPALNKPALNKLARYLS